MDTDKIRFRIARLTEWCYETQSSVRKYWLNSINIITKSRTRPLFFAYCKVAICTFTIVFFATPHFEGLRRYNDQIPKMAFFMVLLIEWAFGVLLLVACKKWSPTLCLAWCFSQTFTILLLLLLTLSELVRIAWPGILLLSVMTTLNLCGLWLIYYFYLQLKNCPEMRSPTVPRERHESKDPFDIKYFNNRKNSRKNSEDDSSMGDGPKLTRRDTDRTSVYSSEEAGTPTIDVSNHRKGSNDSNGAVHAPFRRYFFSSTESESQRSSTDAEANKTLKYAEVQVICENGNNDWIESNLKESHSARSTGESNNATTLGMQHGNNTFSNLMCGGTSTVNVDD